MRLARLGRRDDAEVDLVAQQRVVAREQRQAAVAHAVDPRIADVREGHAIVVEDAARQGRAHAAITRVDAAGLVYRTIGALYAFA